MAINVKHSKVSTIPDGDDTSLIRPSDWNADHVLDGTVPVENGGTGASTLTGYVKGNGTSAMTAANTIPSTDITGLGTMASQNANNVSITGGSISGTTVSGYIPTTEKAAANGVATLDSAGKVPIGQIPDAVIGALNYQGTWNASTNTPTLTSSVGTKGYYYVVSVAGTTDLNGVTDWQIGDWAVYNGTAWQKVDNTDGVTSVNGFTGAVTLTTTNIAEGTNLYYTDARARASLSAGTGISYNSTTGVITNSSPSLGGDVVGPSSATDNAIARFDTTTGKLIQNSTVTVSDAGDVVNVNSVDFDITPGTLPTAQGTLFWDNADSIQTLSLVMEGGNAIQQIGEETYFRIKCSSAITEGQVVMFTGTVGSSGGLTGAPATGLTAATASYVMGVATESGALNDWIYVTSFGLVRGINTTGGAEAWVDGQILYYNPSVAGGLTKTLPSAPNAKIQVCAVVHADSNGSLFIRPSFGGELGQYEGDVQVTTPANGDLLIRNQTSGKWVNAPLTAGTAISVSNAAGAVTINNTGVTSLTAGTAISVSASTGGVTVTNTAPDQTVAISSGTGISVTGTYPNFTVTNTAPSSGGTVTSVTATAPVASTGGTTPVISMPAATTSVSGYLTSTDWNTFNNKGSGSVTSVAASVPSFLSVSGSPITTSGTLAISYSGTALPIANGGTNATSFTAPSGNVKALVYFDGTKQATDTVVTDAGYDTTTNTLNSRNFIANNGMICNSNTVSSSYTIPSGSSAMAVGPMTVASGQSVTVSSGSRWVVL